jgi:hypothetical protein
LRSRQDGFAGNTYVGWAIAASPRRSKVFVTGYSFDPNQPQTVDYVTVA